MGLSLHHLLYLLYQASQFWHMDYFLPYEGGYVTPCAMQLITDSKINYKSCRQHSMVKVMCRYTCQGETLDEIFSKNHFFYEVVLL